MDGALHRKASATISGRSHMVRHGSFLRASSRRRTGNRPNTLSEHLPENVVIRDVFGAGARWDWVLRAIGSRKGSGELCACRIMARMPRNLMLKARSRAAVVRLKTDGANPGLTGFRNVVGRWAPLRDVGVPLPPAGISIRLSGAPAPQTRLYIDLPRAAAGRLSTSRRPRDRRAD